MNEKGEYIVTCNGVILKKDIDDVHYIDLEYRTGRKKNVIISIKDFGTSVYKLSKRVKDLLEIAGYLFAADRESSRGKPDNVEYHSWSRCFHIHIKVRDYKFWNAPEIKYLLSDILCFITGDKEYKFTFYKGDIDFPTNLFDTEKFVLDTKKNISIALFSGGLDSLAGIIERLETTKDEICLVSHQSGQPSVMQTQNNLYESIKKSYPDRCKHYKFHCGLSHTKSVDETQRTRAFLFTSMAFAIASTYKQDKIFVYENGITSLNFAKTQDMMNGRASRTTHPQTIALLEKLFTKIVEKDFKIEHPFLFKTKTDVVKGLKGHKKLGLLDSSVSCSATRNRPPEKKTHCGVCSQCIDRRFAVYSSSTERYDENGIYHFNFLKDDLENPTTIKSLVDYIRLAQSFAEENEDAFYMNRPDQIAEIDEYLEGKTEQERVNKLYDLCKRHSRDIENAIQRMREIHDKPLARYNPKSFFNLIVGPREYQNPEKVIINGKEKLKTFKRGELKKELNKYIDEFKLKDGVTVRTKTSALITRKLIAEGWNANERSVAVTLRKMGYGEELQKY